MIWSTGISRAQAGILETSDWRQFDLNLDPTFVQIAERGRVVIGGAIVLQDRASQGWFLSLRREGHA